MLADDFTWDDAKKRSNFVKHGVRFEEAIDVFKDAFAIEFEDNRNDYGEQRFIIIGRAHNRVLSVVYTPRHEEIRLISARVAEPFERRLYYDFNKS
jgi:uncharacterized DUF497 family protein